MRNCCEWPTFDFISTTFR